jgi:ribosomal protein S25
VETTCENPFGKEYSYTEEIDVLQIKDNLSQIIRKSEEEKIRKAVEDIESNLSDIENELNQTYTDELSRDELYEKARKIIQKEGVVEYGELKSRFGVKDRTMSNIVHKLKRNGVVQYPDDVHPIMNSDFRIEYIEEIGTLEDDK